MSPEQLAARNRAISEGQKRAWRDPDIRARRSAAISRAFDDPLKRALLSAAAIKDRRGYRK